MSIDQTSPSYNKSNKIIGYALWFLVLALIAYIKWAHHELWKDEWQAWFVAKDMSIGEIFSFLYYEGHPSLWYLYLKMWTPLSQALGEENTIQLAHLVTVAIGMYFLCVRFTMHWIIKLLLICSYFLFFEYGVVNRGYFLVIASTFWIVDMYRNNPYSPPDSIKMMLAYVLLCQTEVYGVFIAIGLMFYYMLTYGRQVKSWFSDKSTIGLIVGMLFFIISVFPRSSGHIAKTQGKSWDLSEKIGIALQGNLSNTYLIGSTYDTAQYGADSIGMLLSLVVVIGFILIFRKNRNQGLSMLAFIFMMLMFSVLFFSGGVRQWGLGFVMFIAMIELCGWTDLRDKLSIGVISIFSVFSIVHGAKAVSSDIKIPFTNAKEIGEYIKEKVPANVPVVAMNKFAATPVLGYAGRKFYELPNGTPFSYFKWVDKVYLPTEAELKLFAKYKGVRGIVIVSPESLDNNRFPNAKQWLTFTGENYKNENYYLYTLAL